MSKKAKAILCTTLVVVGLLGAFACSSGSSVAGTNAGNDQPAAGTTAAKPPAKPKTLLTLSGNGIKKSAKFTTGDSWTLAYTYDCSGFGDTGNFIVTLYTDGNMDGILVNLLGAKGKDTVPSYSAGEHYLEMNSECKLTVTVTG